MLRNTGRIAVAALLWSLTVAVLESQSIAAGGAKAEQAREIVERYWSSPAPNRYALLADSYKATLRRIGIRNARDYARETQDPERFWGDRTYQKVDVGHDTRQNRDTAQVVVLVNWEQEGYRGVMTYIFDLVDENGWRIGYIMH